MGLVNPEILTKIDSQENMPKKLRELIKELVKLESTFDDKPSAPKVISNSYEQKIEYYFKDPEIIDFCKKQE